MYAKHFSVVDDAASPQPWMQLRQVVSAETASVSKLYDPADGQSKNEAIQALQTQWTNNTPLTQWVYGLVTTAGRECTLQCRSRGYLSTSHGYKIAADGSNIPMTEVSRFGIGADLGNGGLLALGGAYGIAGKRDNSNTIPFMPHQTGWFSVAPGETIHARAQVSFVSEFWENTMISGGDADTESKIISGDLRIDLWALPAMTPPGPRLTPSIVGGATNIQYNRQLGINTTVPVPANVVAGDTLVAVVCNQLGLSSAIEPTANGWTMLHSIRDGLSGWGDVHMRVFIRTATNSEPSDYTFGNSIAAEEIAVLFAVRNAAAYDSDGRNWYVASNYVRYQFNEQQIAPSVNVGGQLLICPSYISHSNVQAPITQAAPPGMTLLRNFTGSGCTLALASLDNPPSPTLDRQFTPNKHPWLFGHAITASIVVPGLQT